MQEKNRNKGYKKIGTKNDKSLYEAVIEVGIDSYGKRKRIKRRHTGNEESAKKWYAELVRQYYHKVDTINFNDLTFEEYCGVFIEKYCIPNISKVTTKDYKMLLKDIIPLIGKLKLSKITTFILDDMYIRLKKGKKGKEISSVSLNHYYVLVNLMLNQAKKWKFIEYNPNADANRPKIPKRKKRFYDETQVMKLLECLKLENIKYQTIIILSLIIGVRRGELCALRWSDIDFENKKIYIDNSLKVVEGVVDEETAKTPYSIRNVYFGNAVLILLNKYKKWQNEWIKQKGNKWVGDDRVFTAKNGKHMHPDTCNKILSKIIKKYDLPKISFHELRHTFSSMLNGNAVDPVTLQTLLGHANPNFSLDRYTHPLEKNILASVNVFESILETSGFCSMAQNYGTTFEN